MKHIKLYEEQSQSNDIDDTNLLELLLYMIGKDRNHIKDFINILNRFEVSLDEYIVEFNGDNDKDGINITDLLPYYGVKVCIRNMERIYGDLLELDEEGEDYIFIVDNYGFDSTDIDPYSIDNIYDLRKAYIHKYIFIEEIGGANEFINEYMIIEKDPKMLNVMFDLELIDSNFYNRIKKSKKYKGIIKL